MRGKRLRRFARQTLLAITEPISAEVQILEIVDLAHVLAPLHRNDVRRNWCGRLQGKLTSRPRASRGEMEGRGGNTTGKNLSVKLADQSAAKVRLVDHEKHPRIAGGFGRKAMGWWIAGAICALPFIAVGLSVLWARSLAPWIVWVRWIALDRPQSKSIPTFEEFASPEDNEDSIPPVG